MKVVDPRRDVGPRRADHEIVAHASKVILACEVFDVHLPSAFFFQRSHARPASAGVRPIAAPSSAEM